MNKEDKELTFLLVLVLALGMWLGLLSSCSTQYHMSKFIKKGGKIKNDTTLVTLSDTVRINGIDSIIYRTFNIDCPEMQAPKTRFETRIEYRYKKSKDKIVYRTLYRTKKQQVKENISKDKQQRKIETKNNKTLNLLLIVVGLITLTILAFKFSK